MSWVSEPPLETLQRFSGLTDRDENRYFPDSIISERNGIIINGPSQDFSTAMYWSFRQDTSNLCFVRLPWSQDVYRSGNLCRLRITKSAEHTSPPSAAPGHLCHHLPLSCYSFLTGLPAYILAPCSPNSGRYNFKIDSVYVTPFKSYSVNSPWT